MSDDQSALSALRVALGMVFLRGLIEETATACPERLSEMVAEVGVIQGELRETLRRQQQQQHQPQPVSDSPEPLLDVTGVAGLLGLKPATIRAYVEQGELPVVRLGGRLRFTRRDVETLIEKRRKEAA